MLRHSNAAPVVSMTDAKAAYQAAQCVVKTHQRLVDFLQVGQTLAQIDRFVAQTLADLKCRSCFLGYKVPRTPPFPSHACLSVNACIVHGTAASLTRPLVEGDVISIDIGVLHKGWIGDAAWTYSLGKPEAEVRRLMDCGKASIRRSIPKLDPKNRYVEWAKTLQGYVEGECGFSLVRGLGGHGFGRKLHTPPFISNVVPTFPGEWPEANKHCASGILVAVEPMIAAGTNQTIHKRGQWPIYTADGSMSVHYEHDVYITPDGPWVLTEGLDELPDEIG